MIKLQLLTSMCARNEYYMERVERIAQKLNLNFTLERITDREVIYEMGVSVNCCDYYCPGCQTMHSGGGACAPALFINGQMAFCDHPPDDPALEACLTRFL